MPPVSSVEKTSQATFSEKLRRIPIFHNIKDSEIAAFQSLFYETAYSKETVIFYEQDFPSKSGSRIYFVLEGCVKLVKYSSDGESTIVRLASAGEFFGVTGALLNKPYPFSAEALTETTLMYIHQDDFKALLSKSPDVSVNLICALGEVLWFNYATHNQVVKKSDARVAKILLYHLERDGTESVAEGLLLKINLPHDYIASMTGIAYEESVRILSRLKKQNNCIKYQRGGKIIITDLQELKRIADEPNAYGN